MFASSSIYICIGILQFHCNPGYTYLVVDLAFSAPFQFSGNQIVYSLISQLEALQFSTCRLIHQIYILILISLALTHAGAETNAYIQPSVEIESKCRRYSQ